MEGMSNIYERNVQTDKELVGIKKTLGLLMSKEKEKEQGRAESSTIRNCLAWMQNEGRNKEFHGDGNYGNGQFFTRFSKLNFPHFSSCELHTWLYKVDQVFSMEEIPFKQRVKVDSIHLDGKAIARHMSYTNSKNTASKLSWSEYVLVLNKRFGDGFEDPIEASKNLRQTGSVKEYQAKFDRLLTRVNLSNENAIS
ncbi:uncharacterized protein LOC124887118 [Capsicum annuum]|uniref:uncharacterized protein LOC124887118 n=1 Tax=Capsicum annuum TaxID=4072 RepID=UPI001FB097CC|nr:uncharacterized protein LOC124887118 [Capsicum annuum]